MAHSPTPHPSSVGLQTASAQSAAAPADFVAAGSSGPASQTASFEYLDVTIETTRMRTDLPYSPLTSMRRVHHSTPIPVHWQAVTRSLTRSPQHHRYAVSATCTAYCTC